VSRPLIVSWKRYQRRSDVLAERLGADVLWRPHRFVQRVLRPLDYIHHAVQDLVSIRRVQPSVVIVQSPPHIAAIAPWSLRLPLVIDAHNAQLQSWWRGAPGARSLLAAARVVLTHTAEADEIAREVYPGLRTLVVHDPLRPIPEAPELLDRVFFVASGAADEPIAALLDAIEALPDIEFATTAPLSRMPRRVRARARRLRNIRWLGFLSVPEYERAIASARAVVVLTTRPATQPSGACEALSACRPLVVSRTRTTEALFGSFATLVDNTAASIAEGIQRSLEDSDTERIRRARDAWMSRSEVELQRLIEFLGG